MYIYIYSFGNLFGKRLTFLVTAYMEILKCARIKMTNKEKIYRPSKWLNSCYFLSASQTNRSASFDVKRKRIYIYIYIYIYNIYFFFFFFFFQHSIEVAFAISLLLITDVRKLGYHKKKVLNQFSPLINHFCLPTKQFDQGV